MNIPDTTLRFGLTDEKFGVHLDCRVNNIGLKIHSCHRGHPYGAWQEIMATETLDQWVAECAEMLADETGKPVELFVMMIGKAIKAEIQRAFVGSTTGHPPSDEGLSN